MALSIGIIGLPNVGKSTTLNALTKEQNAEAANYPFCTIESNRAVVTVPDPRLDKLGELSKPRRVVHAAIEFIDIAGLVEGASQGEGLGNRFLAHIRETAAILHVVRCFEDANVAHVRARPDPRADVEIIDTEVVLADLEQVERKIERLSKQIKGDKKLKPVLDTAKALAAHLAEGRPAPSFLHHDSDLFKALNTELRLITDKPVIFVANVDEDTLAEDNQYVTALREVADAQGSDVVKLCAKVEEEMAGLTQEERDEFLQALGASESGLDQVIRNSYRALGLISFFTTNPNEAHAWTIPDGTTAYEAAGVVHTDFQRGFIRAEVIPYDAYLRRGSEAAAKAAGEMALEGKDYVMKDADVAYFRFNR